MEPIQALVMELVDGETLADRIASGPIPVDEALAIAKQIAEALEAAHDQGIIHRDLKPANVKVRSDGAVKVLDFGLAKALGPPEGGQYVQEGRSVRLQPDLTASPTITSPALLTGVGVLLGTAAYMSPEQARGKAVDKRSDIWAFGCVLYEMLTGRRAFGGDDVTETLATILKGEPDWSALSPDLPIAIRRILRRALTKVPRERLGDIRDARLDIEEALAAPGKQEVEGIAGAARVRSLWAASISAAAILGAVATMLIVRLVTAATPPSSAAVTRFSITPASGVVLSTGSDESLAISRDGGRIVYVGTRAGTSQLYLRSLETLESVPIRGSEGTGTTVFFSPDGEWVGFLNARTMKKLPVTGGAPQTICETCATHTPSWGANEIIVFPGVNGGLMQVSSSGGTPVRVTAPTGEVHREPRLLPDGKAVLFVIRREGQADKIAAVACDWRATRVAGWCEAALRRWRPPAVLARRRTMDCDVRSWAAGGAWRRKSRLGRHSPRRGRQWLRVFRCRGKRNTGVWPRIDAETHPRLGR
jgi:hypothetical protein